jgi:hypothetical protein
MRMFIRANSVGGPLSSCAGGWHERGTWALGGRLE